MDKAAKNKPGRSEPAHSEPSYSELTHPHDLLVRNILGDADIAADLLRNYLPAELASTLDFDSLERAGGDSVAPNLSKLVGDLRYSAKFTGSNEELNVFVFLEHQSRPDPLMAFRLLEYVVAAYRQYVPELRNGRRFPYPLAVVLHHGPRPWKRIPSMRELISLHPGLPSDILNLPICLIDAATLPLDDLHGHPVVCALLDSLQSASTGQLPERLEGIFIRLRNIYEESRLKAWSMALATYYGAVEGYAQKNVDAIHRAFTALLGSREADKMTVTIAEHYRREGEARGRAEGKAEGKAEGRRDVARAALRKNMPAEVIAELTGLSPSEIQQLVEA